MAELDLIARCRSALKWRPQGEALHTRCRWAKGHREQVHKGRGLERFDYQRITWVAGDSREYETDREDESSWSEPPG